MPLALGLDLGTTTLTALALDVATGVQAARVTTAIPREAYLSVRAAHEQPRSEWDAPTIARAACACLRELSLTIGTKNELLGLAITGQQHGVVLLDGERRPLGPFISWQDRRGDDLVSGTSKTWVETARSRLGENAPRIAGCKLAAGYMGLTLFWLAEQRLLPERATACFLVDYVASLLTEKPPVTDPTLAASSGLLDVVSVSVRNQAILSAKMSASFPLNMVSPQAPFPCSCGSLWRNHVRPDLPPSGRRWPTKWPTSRPLLT